VKAYAESERPMLRSGIEESGPRRETTNEDWQLISGSPEQAGPIVLQMQLPEESYKRECPEKTASRRLDVDLFSAFSPTE